MRWGVFGSPRTVYRLLAKSRRRRLFQAKRRLYAQFVRPGDLCFDIGASVGDRCRVIRSIGGRVVAVEPQPRSASAIRREFPRDPHVQIVESAVGAECGTATLCVPAALAPLASVSNEFIRRMTASPRFGHLRWETQLSVRMTTLDELIHEFGLPHFCKVDVEGYEDAVFGGLGEPIEIVSFEYNEEFVAPAKAAVKRLAELAQYQFNVSLGETMVLLWPQWRSAYETLEFLDTLDASLPYAFGDVYATLAVGTSPPR